VVFEAVADVMLPRKGWEDHSGGEIGIEVCHTPAQTANASESDVHSRGKWRVSLEKGCSAL